MTTKYRLASPRTARGWRWFEKSGDKRPPRRGEFFLSGAIPTVYQAPNDLPSAYNIMVEIEPPPREVTVDGFTYRLVVPATPM